MVIFNPSDPSYEPTATGAEKVRGFFEALAAGSEAGSLEFGQILLKNYAPVVRQSIPDVDDLSEFELLVEIARYVLEDELVDTLQQFERKAINKKEFSTLCAAFWRVLLMHIELFLRQPPASGHALIVEAGGEYRIVLEGKPTYVFQEPFSTGKIKSLVASLGNVWVIRYLEGYTLNKKIPHLYQALEAKQEAVFGWVENKSSRWLNKAQAAFCAKLWNAHANQTAVVPDISRENLARNRIALALDRARQGQNEAIHVQADLMMRDELRKAYAKALDESLSVQEKPPFIVPDLQIEDEQGNRIPAFLEDVMGIQGFCLLAGLPGGGKSRVQAWVARQRLSENLGVDIFLDLREYVKSGIASPYEFAADQLVRSFGVAAGMDELRSFLIEVDRKKMLYWHVENWDRVAEDERKRCLTSLAGLSTVLVSTENPQEIKGLARERNLVLPKKIFHLLPWSDHKKSIYIEEYSRLRPEADRSRIMALVNQLPGVSSLPAGIWCICENNSPSLADILIGYLSARQTSMGYPAVTLSITHSTQGCFVDWGNPFVNQAYEMVSALLRRGPVKEFDVKRLERIDAIALGSHLMVQGENLEAKTKRAEALFKDGCRGGLLYKVSSLSCAFVIPEIAHLLAAAAVCASYPAGSVFEEFHEFYNQNPFNRSNQILRAFADWYARREDAKIP